MIDKHDIKLTLALNQVRLNQEDPQRQKAYHPIKTYVKRLKQQRTSYEKVGMDYNLELEPDKNH